MNPSVRATLEVAFASADAARKAQAALGADDDAYVETHAAAAILTIALRAPDVAGLLRALDDGLAQLSVFEDLIRDAPGALPRA